MTRILAGDIGGTKCLFGLFENGVCVRQCRLASADFAQFADALAAALGDFSGAAITRACLAVAGPVDDDGRGAKITNLPWRIDAAALEARFGLPHLRLANDFAAAAIGAVHTPAGQRFRLQEGQPLADAPHLVLGAGTGLGMAIVLPEGSGWRVVPGEGGHVAFAPADDAQLALWRALRQQHGRVTWERVVSGPGLEFIYRLICARNGEPARLPIGALADAPPGSAADEAIGLFLACYGAYAGDMAMTVLPRAGVHLAGGIAAKLLPRLTTSGFLAAFNAKAEHAGLAARMPVDVCIDPGLGLCGAAMLAEPIC